MPLVPTDCVLAPWRAWSQCALAALRSKCVAEALPRATVDRSSEIATSCHPRRLGKSVRVQLMTNSISFNQRSNIFNHFQSNSVSILFQLYTLPDSTTKLVAPAQERWGVSKGATSGNGRLWLPPQFRQI